MDKIARIRAEIERRLNILTNVYAEQVERKDEEMMNYYHGKVIALEELRPFLNTLSEEPCKSLEEAAEEYTQKMLESWKFDSTGCRPPRESFIAGAEWQKEQDQPITGNSLEQEWLRYVNKKKKECRGELPSLGEYGWLQIARHFAEWQKEQMLKDAVEATVMATKCGDKYQQLLITDWNSSDGLHNGDKVRIIIVKED